MIGEEFDQLVADIKTHGLYNPITVLGNVLLDGRNRFRACQKAGIEPDIKELEGNTSETGILDFVVASNLRRRHLNAGQAAMIAKEFVPLYAKAAKERQIAAGVHGKEGGRGHQKPLGPKKPKGFKADENSANAIVARKFGIGRSTVGKAIAVDKANSELANEVRKGNRGYPPAEASHSVSG